MKQQRPLTLLAIALFSSTSWHSLAANNSEEQLQQRVIQLQKELKQTKGQLSQLKQSSPSLLDSISFNGALRANYVIGSYDIDTSGPSRGGHGGDFDLDVFRIDLGLNHGNWIGELQYRWYRGYNMLHTGWLGYQLNSEEQIKVGVQRVPFGPGAWGISQSWFFDQHYYVGLSDDMDLGLTYQKKTDKYQLDFGYFIADEGSWRGNSTDSARYSYDIVKWSSSVDQAGNISASSTNGYEEENQFNLRFIYHTQLAGHDAQLGTSLQYGELNGVNAEDGDHWAASLHMINDIDGYKLATQLTRYEIDISNDNAWGSDDLIPMGAFDFAWLTATEAWVFGTSISKSITTPSIDWLDSITPFIEYSVIEKDEDAFNSSELVTAGAAWASGGWYIYSEIAFSNGNYFVGNDGDSYGNLLNGVGDFGVNGNDKWNHRFNLNLGYYF